MRNNRNYDARIRGFGRRREGASIAFDDCQDKSRERAGWKKLGRVPLKIGRLELAVDERRVFIQLTRVDR